MKGGVCLRLRPRWPFYLLIVGVSALVGATGRWVWDGREVHDLTLDESMAAMQTTDDAARQRTAAVLVFQQAERGILALRKARDRALSDKTRESIDNLLARLASEAQGK